MQFQTLPRVEPSKNLVIARGCVPGAHNSISSLRFERPHADEAFTLMNTSVGALLNELVRSLGKADLRNAHQVWRPACNGQEEEFELAHCRVNVEGRNKTHGNDDSNNRQHTHNWSRFPRQTRAGNG